MALHPAIIDLSSLGLGRAENSKSTLSMRTIGSYNYTFLTEVTGNVMSAYCALPVRIRITDSKWQYFVFIPTNKSLNAFAEGRLLVNLGNDELPYLSHQDDFLLTVEYVSFTNYDDTVNLFYNCGLDYSKCGNRRKLNTKINLPYSWFF